MSRLAKPMQHQEDLEDRPVGPSFLKPMMLLSCCRSHRAAACTLWMLQDVCKLWRYSRRLNTGLHTTAEASADTLL